MQEPLLRPLLLVTGADGFIGRAVIEKFKKTFDIVGLELKVSPHPSPDVDSVAMDVTSDSSVAAALARVRAAHGSTIASVIHLAAYFDLTGHPDSRYDEITVGGTKRLIEALQRFDVEQFIFMSTMLVHAPSGPDARIDEHSPLDTRFPYRASKVHTEAALREAHGKIPIAVFRPAGVYDDECHSAFLAQQIARINERRLTSHVYPADLRTGQPFLHLDDLTDALERAVSRRAELPAQSTMLLAESDVMGFGEIQDALGHLLHGEDWLTLPMPKMLASQGAWLQEHVLGEDPFIRPWMVEISNDDYRVDTAKANALLGWRARRSLRETLPKMIGALKADPRGWYVANRLDPALVAADSVEAERRAEVANQKQPAEPPADAPSKATHADEMQQHMRRSHFDMLWVHWVNVLLGAWLVSSAFAFGSFSHNEVTQSVLKVTADRHLIDPASRILYLGVSDVVSGLLVMLFGLASLSPKLSWAQWANTSVGVWLLFAPLVFWAPGAAIYANDTLIGTLVIAFAVLIPMMPGMSMAGMMDASDEPPGWSYSPSTYLQRLPIIALGAVGLLVSRSLAAYQMGHIDAVWDPFFAGMKGLNGTEAIITSSVSKAWPIPDGGLGAVAYTFEILMGVMGDSRRWRTMPWMVAMFGLVVVPLGVISIYFIVIQPIVIGTWCTLCLVTAAAMLAMIPYSLDELVAMGQFLVQSYRRGEPFWRTFFQGGAQPYQGKDKQADFDAPLGKAAASSTRGVTVPWSLAISTLLGAILMFSRVLFGVVPPAANSDHVAGALIITVAVISTAEVARPLRFLNAAFGAWLIIAPWVMTGDSRAAAWMDVAIGVAVIALSLPRGQRSSEHYGSWDRFVV